MIIEEEINLNSSFEFELFECNQCLKFQQKIAIDADFQALDNCPNCSLKNLRSKIKISENLNQDQTFLHKKPKQYLYAISIPEIVQFESDEEDAHSRLSFDSKQNMDILEVSPKINKLFIKLKNQKRKQMQLVKMRTKILMRLTQKKILFQQLSKASKKSDHQICQNQHDLFVYKYKKHAKIVRQTRSFFFDYRIFMKVLMNLCRFQGSHLQRTTEKEVMHFIHLEMDLIAYNVNKQQNTFISIFGTKNPKEEYFKVLPIIKQKLQKNTYKSVMEWWKFNTLSTSSPFTQKCLIPDENILIGVTKHPNSDFWNTIKFFQLKDEFNHVLIEKLVPVQIEGSDSKLENVEYLNRVVYLRYDKKSNLLILVEEGINSGIFLMKIYELRVEKSNKIKIIIIKHLAKLHNFKYQFTDFSVNYDGINVQIIINAETGFKIISNKTNFFSSFETKINKKFYQNIVEEKSVDEIETNEVLKKEILYNFDLEYQKVIEPNPENKKLDSFWGWPTKRVKLNDGTWMEGETTFLQDKELKKLTKKFEKLFVSEYPSKLVNQDFQKNQNIIDYQKNKKESAFEIVSFKVKKLLKYNYFEYCLDLGDNRVLLLDYQQVIYIYNYMSKTIENEYKPKQEKKALKYFEFKAAVQVKKKSMVLLLSTKGDILPFVYSGKECGFKSLIRISKIGYDYKACPFTQIYSNKESKRFDMYQKSSIYCREHKATTNPYFIKKSIEDLFYMLRNLKNLRANKILFDEVEDKVLVFKKNVVFVCGFSFKQKLVINKILVFAQLVERVIDWNSVELFGKYGGRKLMFLSKEETIGNVFYKIEYIV